MAIKNSVSNYFYLRLSIVFTLRLPPNQCEKGWILIWPYTVLNFVSLYNLIPEPGTLNFSKNSLTKRQVLSNESIPKGNDNIKMSYSSRKWNLSWILHYQDSNSINSQEIQCPTWHQPHSIDSLLNAFFAVCYTSSFSILPFSKGSFSNTIKVQLEQFESRSGILSGLFWVQTVCKCYQQKTLSGQELTHQCQIEPSILLEGLITTWNKCSYHRSWPKFFVSDNFSRQFI